MALIDFQNISRQVCFVTFGIFIAFIILPIYIIICLPVIIYRYIVCNLIAPCYAPKIGEAVTYLGAGMATEFIPEKSQCPPRCAIACCFTVEGSLEPREVRELVNEKWITFKDKAGRLKYPEFQQYIEPFMGFMFWKKDTTFQLDNHLIFHNVTAEGSGQFLDDLMEELLNKPFPPRRSPWEIHVIPNYRVEEFHHCESTAVLFRTHHSMGDGFSFMAAAIEGILGVPTSSMGIALSSKPPELSSLKLGFKILTLPVKILHDLGYAVFKNFTPDKGCLYIPDENKKWNQMVAKSQRIPIATIKEIKNHFGVGFTSVLLSSIGAGLAKTMKQKTDKLLLATALPLSRHPDKLRNHVTGTILDVQTKSDLESKERLLKTEMNFSRAKYSTIPLFLPMLGWLTSFYPTPLLPYFAGNRFLSAALTNFPGPSVEIEWKGKRVLESHFACGGLSGVAGVAFMVLSYHKHIRIVVTAESAALERSEVEDLVRRIHDEIIDLHKLSNQMKQESKNIKCDSQF